MTVPPRATYRLQLRNGMDFAGAAAIVPYLARLGVSHLYLSPPFTAAPGSTHGYDVVDPNRFDPALGGEAGFLALRRALDAHGLGLILDIVPNHMGIGRANAWWWDVLRHGGDSDYAGFFDIDFAADPDGKLVLPVLGDGLDEVLARGELRIVAEDGDDLLAYFDERFPLAPGTPPDGEIGAALNAQHYRLVGWREGAARRNYRRFFNIDQLAALRIEATDVFEASHVLILDLAARGLIEGLRIDHIDGLTDPKAYLDRLRDRLADVRGDAPPIYLVVEKILVGEETLPDTWPVAGTTGYEFMNEVLRVQASGPGLDELAGVAQRFTGEPQDFPALATAAKAEVLERLFAGEEAALARQTAEVLGLEAVTAAELVRQVLVNMPVYRTYVGAAGWSVRDLAVLEEVLERAAIGADDATLAGLGQLERRLAGQDGAITQLLRALQRLSGPVMAKAVEDTSFYRYHRLLAMNEVGGEADSAAWSPDEFHRRAAWRREHWPDTMLATATHDTKRGEDARARLAVLSELPAEWERAATGWRELNGRLPAIHPADEYALYQSLVGAWPTDLRADDAAGLAALADRLEGWLLKALREGKQRSDWNDPDQDYERRAVGFLRGSLAPGGAFAAEVAAFVARLAAPAQANSLGQLLLKLTAPGVPDIYQGTELWDGSLVDPDNRRPVDFADLASREGPPKLALIEQVLRLRTDHPHLFSRGSYRPLSAAGRHADAVLAFARVHGTEVAVTLTTRLTASRGDRWDDTALVMPGEWHGRGWQDRLQGGPVRLDGDRVLLDPLLGTSPVALLTTA